MSNKDTVSASTTNLFYCPMTIKKHISLACYQAVNHCFPTVHINLYKIKQMGIIATIKLKLFIII